MEPKGQNELQQYKEDADIRRKGKDTPSDQVIHAWLCLAGTARQHSPEPSTETVNMNGVPGHNFHGSVFQRSPIIPLGPPGIIIR